VRADLHSHSTASDGSLPPAAVMARARAAGLDAIALTDHDTVAGHAEARRSLPPGLTLVPGVELSCRRDGASLHLLGYLFDPAEPQLAAECAKLRDARVRRARAIVERLAALGAPLTWAQVQAAAGGSVVGRPHIAQAMVAAGIVASQDEAFGPQWLGAGGRAHVARYALDPVRAVGLVRAAGGVTVLAHPGAVGRGPVVPDDYIAALAAAGLTGIEVFHPGHNGFERMRLASVADKLGLVPTGGSDDHGAATDYRVGCDTISRQPYERLLRQATGAAPVSG
jgi:predicted metal-dependent phosphoesterase TrpH